MRKKNKNKKRLFDIHKFFSKFKQKNNTTKMPSYQKSMFNTFGLEFYQDIIYLCLIPIGFIGVILNILTFLILRGEQFKLPVFHYLRAHSINSCCVCLIISTVIACHIDYEWSAKYYSHIYIPILNFLVFYQTSLDTVLTFDRALTFTTKFEKFRQFKPKLVSLIVLVTSIVMDLPSWITFTTQKTEIQLNGTTTVFIYHSVIKPNEFFYLTNSIINGIPFFVELPLNILTMILLKRYLKRRVDFRKARPPNHPDGFLLRRENRIRKMEMKLTYLVVILSLLSFM
jgi:hypothetical protein